MVSRLGVSAVLDPRIVVLFVPSRRNLFPSPGGRAHLFPGAGVCFGVVAGEVGSSQPIRLFIGEAVHHPAINSDLPIHAALAQHFAEGFA